jgi:Fur family transcriptional regulator, ferric uptake regulator
MKGPVAGAKVAGRVRVHDVERLRRRLEAHMRQRGLRSTDQRRAIIDTFFDIDEHATIDRLAEMVRIKDPRVGYATVYRAVRMLVASGVAKERRFGDGQTRYELADERAHHAHLICVACSRIIEFEEPGIEQLSEQVAERHGFDLHERKHELIGLCPQCRKG